VALGAAHLAKHKAKNGEHATWLEPVTDEQYGAKVGERLSAGISPPLVGA
jgi:hypothetical protein